MLTVAPGVVTRTWVGEDTTGAKVLGAGFGARDVAIGAGLWRALDAGEDARPWLLAGAASDAADLLATLAARSLDAALGRVGDGDGRRRGRGVSGVWAARQVAP